jgi:hypothetical protein
MANSHHQQSLQRKLIYIGMILAIFFVLIFYRTYAVSAKATELLLNEADRGEVELTGKAVVLTLSGFRGVAVTVLWNAAREKMEKNQWSELDLYTRWTTRLQPHFITPWLFQSWNLSYNVAVNCDREADQYFYITRGLDLLAEGERENRYNPEMRYYVGFYGQHKIMLADRTNVLLAFYQMSSIDPVQRDPRRFRKADSSGNRDVIDLDKFEKFCQEHPQLVRRLREKVRCASPADVVQFLEENQRLPSLYEDDPNRLTRKYEETEETKLRAPNERFPVLPPGPLANDAGALTREKNIEDWVDAYVAARAWYSYAVECLPDPSWIPGRFKPITDPIRQHTPRFTTLLFRNYPARAQSYTATRLEEDGWFDREGWTITRWFKDPTGKDKPVVVGNTHNWTQEAWRDAFNMWLEIGRNHGLYLSAEQERNLKVLAEKFAQNIKQPVGPPPDIEDETSLNPEFRAYIFMWNYDFYRRLSNYPHFLNQAQTFSDPATVQARKHFHNAIAAKIAGNRRQAIEEFEKALPVYNDILKSHEDFRTDEHIAEETLDYQLGYLTLCRELYGRVWKQALLSQAFLGLSATGAAPGAEPLPLALTARVHLLPDADLKGPLDDTLPPEFMKWFKSVRNPQRGPPPGVDPRAAGQEMMRQRMLNQMPPGAQPPPGGSQISPDTKMPPGMQPGGGIPGRAPVGKK